MLEVLAHDAVGGQAEAVAVEAQRSVEVVDAEGDEGDAGAHGRHARMTARGLPHGPGTALRRLRAMRSCLRPARAADRGSGRARVGPRGTR
ncbi:hypothetical protein ABXN37_13925 [Piscinibacter sakaiensis]|uniref:hypothetical protein n=1 Tax=Piscinibacter sakaiensis TaxID=1547922 RepID=UPI00372B9C33